MNRFNVFIRITLLSAALTASLHAADATKPNILVIYTDDQGYGDMSALNPESKFQTPHLDRIAHEGLTFTDGHCADTVCTPSRYALLTGRYSWRTSLKSGVLHAEGDCLIAKERMTVASLLRDNGYHTAMFGKWHLQMKFPGSVGKRDWSQPITDGPNAHGFEEFFGIPASMNYGVLTFIENTRVTEAPSLWTHKKTDKEHDTFRFMPPYDMKKDWRETSNVYEQHKDIVERLEAMATKVVRGGRSTPGPAQKNDGAELWPELTWIPEAASLEKPKSKRKRNADDE